MYIYIHIYIIILQMYVWNTCTCTCIHCMQNYLHVHCRIYMYSKYLHLFPIKYATTKNTLIIVFIYNLCSHIMVSSLLVFLLLVSGIIHFSCGSLFSTTDNNGLQKTSQYLLKCCDTVNLGKSFIFEKDNGVISFICVHLPYQTTVLNTDHVVIYY